MALLLNAGDTVSRSYSYTQPSPLHPSLPQGTGERTGNLWDATKYYYTSLSENNIWVYSTSLTGSVYRIPCKPNTTYTLYLAENVDITIWRIREVSTDDVPNASSTSVPTTGTYASSVPASKSATFTTSASARYILFQANETAYDSVLPVIMLIEGTTKIPYEPYGIKIPISSASTTTPVYLGEVETTRKIRKYEFTGNENWSFSTYPYLNGFITYSSNYLRQKINICVCSHLQTSANVQSGEAIVPDTCCFNVENLEGVLYYKDTSISDLASFKSWLAAQYAAGTPVTVWYVLATETTGIVNEPIRKIGDYADAVSGITIPTIAGANSFDVLTTLKPSEVTVNYKGWHPVQSVHERENGAWT